MKTYSNLTPIPTPKYFENLRQMLDSSAELYGDKVLYNYKDDGPASELKQMTYGQFNDRVHSFAEGLFEYGLAGKTVAVIGDTHPDWVCAYYSVFCSGGIIVPLDHDLAVRKMKIHDLFDFFDVFGRIAFRYRDAVFV